MARTADQPPGDLGNRVPLDILEQAPFAGSHCLPDNAAPAVLRVSVGRRFDGLGHVEVTLDRGGTLTASNLLFQEEFFEVSTTVPATRAEALIDACHRALVQLATRNRVPPNPCEPLYRIELLDLAGERVIDTRLPRRQIAAHAVLAAVLGQLHDAANDTGSVDEPAATLPSDETSQARTRA